MKKVFLLFFLASLFIFPVFVVAKEGIDTFNVSLLLNKDGSFDISETILYDFGTAQRHGIFRDIPVKYESKLGKRSIRLSDVSVVDVNNIPYPFELSSHGNYKRIKIGDPDKFITGAHEYSIRYTVRGAINYFDNFDEVYWNVTGNEWAVPISNINAIVYLPVDIKTEQIKFSCYQGYFGSFVSCERADAYNESLHEKYNSDMVNQVAFYESELSSKKGLTVAVSVPKGILRQPTRWAEVLRFIEDNYILSLPFIVFIFMFWLWFKKGRDPRGRGAIIAEYEPPSGLTPALIGALVDEKVHNRDITAGIVYLAEQGFLKIRKIEKKWLLGKGDYELELLKDFFSITNNIDYLILELIFGARAAIGTKKGLSELRRDKHFAKEIRSFKKTVIRELIKLDLFASNYNMIRWVFEVLAFFIVFSAILLKNYIDFLSWTSVIISAAIMAVFGHFMGRKTELGVKARGHILGFKEFLSVTEKDRLAFHNAPEKSSEQFMKYLPYAIALGVEKKWAAQFADVYISQPNWYEGNFAGAVFATQLVSDLSDFTSTVNSGFSAASGGSGSGGGGFSGGGFGGGGGGSW